MKECLDVIMKIKKIVFNVIFLAVCFILTMYYVLHGQDFQRLFIYMKEANSLYWIIGVLLVILFILNESVIIFYMMKSLNQKIRISHCFLYSFVGFFFSLVTPSATGGQPAQVLFMKKDNIPIHISTMVLLIVTTAYKLVLILFGLYVVLIRPAKAMEYLEPAMIWIYIGVFLNVVCVGVMLSLIFKPDLLQKFVMGFFKGIKRFVQSESISRIQTRLGLAMDEYRAASAYLRTHKKIISNVVLLTVIQRCFFFIITYFVLVSFGLRTVGFWTVLILQAMISVAVDMLPLPGGMGISEHLFQIIFSPICGELLTVPVMLVSRGLGYYTQLIISASLTIVAYFIIFRGRKNDRIL